MSSMKWKNAPTRRIDVGGGVFQHHQAFVPAVLDFLAD